MNKQNTITIIVRGRPAPQGSKRHIGHGRMIESSRYLPQWRADIINQVLPEHRVHLDEPVCITMLFLLPRTQTKKRGDWHAKRPDLSKLIRATEDALVDAGVLIDDSRIVSLAAGKIYHDEPGAVIVISTPSGREIKNHGVLN